MNCFLLITAATLSVVLGEAGFVQLPLTVERVNHSSLHQTDVAAHGEVGPITIQNSIYQYLVSIALGTPGQLQTVLLDTGSSDLWVFGPGLGAETFYDPSKSSTSKYINSDFSIGYIKGPSASGDYYTDNSSWGGATVNFQFAVAQQEANGGNGIFGIGQVNTERSTAGTYANYPVALKQQGIIESTAYSLYLDDFSASTGSLLFGGVDSSKYSGQLYTLPITSDSSLNVDFEFAGKRLNGVLDSGTSLTYLPDDIVSDLAAQFNATYEANNSAFGASYYVEDISSDSSVTYNFSGAKIVVDASELFIRTAQGNYLITILPSSQIGGPNILGDTFLRSAYVVYDLDNSQIAIAQASYSGSSSSSIEAITSNGIPGAQPAPGF